MDIITAVIVAALGVLLFLYVKYHDRGIFSPPFIDGVPILNSNGGFPLGHLKKLVSSIDWRLESLLESFRDGKIGEVWQQSMPFIITVVTLNVEDVKHVLTNPDVFVKGEDFRSKFHDLLGDGIFNSDGDTWRVQRKTASNIFNVKNFRDVYSDIIVSESKTLVAHLRKTRENNAVVDLQDLLLRSTLDSFGEIAFGESLGCLDMDNGMIVGGRYMMKTSEFMNAFDAANNQVLLRFSNPFWQYTDHFTGHHRSMQDKMEVIDRFCHAIIDKRLSGEKKSAASKAGKMDLLDLFLAAAKEDDTHLTYTELKDICLNFIIAGRDTTAQTLSWLCWNVAQHREVERKIRAEIRRVVGDRDPTYEDFKNLKYCQAVFNETLRLHANVPGNRKTCIADQILPGTKTPIPKGTNVEFNAWAMGRLTSSWGPDCDVFRPERWMTDDGNLMRVDNFKWPVFNAGPRLCLGVNLATQEAVMFLAQVYKNFHLELVNEDDPSHWGLYDKDPSKRRGRYGLAVTLVMKGGVDFRVHDAEAF